jgi:predicted Zn-dependent protease
VRSKLEPLSEPAPIDALPEEAFQALLDRANDLLEAGEPAEAREHARRALAFRPEDASARHLLAHAVFALGQLERALVICEGLFVDYPESAAARVNLAVVLLKLGRPSAARPLLEAVVQSTPEHGRAWTYLGAVLEQLGLVAEANEARTRGEHVRAGFERPTPV